MNRVMEKEIMGNMDSVESFLNADFGKLHQMFISELEQFVGRNKIQTILDIGSGTGVLTKKILKVFPNSIIHCIDGSSEMIKVSNSILKEEIELKRVKTINIMLEDLISTDLDYDLIISSNFIHHLSNSIELWNLIKNINNNKTYIFMMDLLRPKNVDEAKEIVERVSGNESEVMKRDHFNSLLSAFEVNEIKEQLKCVDLQNKLTVKSTKSHLFIYGIL